MNTKASFKYQTERHKYSLLAFYGTVITLMLVMDVVMVAFINDGEGISGGFESTTMIFLFVCGLNEFKENFGMMVQNGVSRKSMFLGRLATTVTISLFAAVVDTLLAQVFRAIFTLNNNVTFYNAYEQAFSVRSSSINYIMRQLESFLFLICFYIFVSVMGYFVTILYYRLNKIGKILVSVGVPIGLIYILSTDNVVCRGILKFLLYVIGAATGNPYLAMSTLLVCSVIFSGFAWLLMRRAEIKNI